MNVFEKAHELGTMIAESDTFKRLNDAREAQSADGEASLVLMNYNRKREQLIKEAAEPGISKISLIWIYSTTMLQLTLPLNL